MPTLMQPDDVAVMVDDPEFAALPSHERSSYLENAIGEASQSFAGKWDEQTWRDWGDFVSGARDRVDKAGGTGQGLNEGRQHYLAGLPWIEDTGNPEDKGKWISGVVPDVARDLGRVGVAGVADLTTVADPKSKSGMRIPGSNIVGGLNEWTGRAADFVSTGISKLTGGQAGLLDEMNLLKAEIDSGHFPMNDPKELGDWLEHRAGKVSEKATGFFDDAMRGDPWEKGYAVTNGLLHPKNARLLSEYMQTRHPGTWEQLFKSIATTPWRAKVDAASAKRLENDAAVNTLSRVTGQDYTEPMKGVGDPINLATVIFPAARSLKAAEALTEAGGMAAAKQAVKGAGEAVFLGNLGLSVNDPNATWAEHMQVSKDMLAMSLGMTGGAVALKKALAGKRGDAETRRAPEEQSGRAAEPQPSGNPFEQPQDRETPPAPDETVTAPSETEPAPNETKPVQSGTKQGPNETPRSDEPSGKKPPIIPDSPLGDYDILDYLNENPITLPRKGTTGTAGEYDWRETGDLPKYYRKFLVSNGMGQPIDVAAQMAYEGGFIREPSVDAMMEEVHSTIKKRTQYRVQMRQRERAVKDEEKRVTAYEGAEAEAKQAVPLDEVAPGDSFDLGGEKDVKVKEVAYDEDGHLETITIEDGRAFGVLTFDATTREAMMVDAWKPKERTVLDDDPFLRRVVKGEALETQTPEEVAAERVRTEQAAEIKRRQEKPLQGTLKPEDTTPDLIDPFEDGLFNQPAQKGGMRSAAMPAGLAMPSGAPPATRTPLPSHHAHGAIPAAATPGHAWSGQRHTLHGIRKYLLNEVGLPAVGIGRIHRALGMYFLRPEAVRLVNANDIPVLSHEVGHAIHAREFTPDRGASGNLFDFGQQYDGELVPLGKPTSLKGYKPAQVRNEGVAEFTRLWLTNPTLARAKAPTFAAYWENMLSAKNAELWAGLEEAQYRIKDFIAMPQFEKAMAQVVFDPSTERMKRTKAQWLEGAYAGWVNTLQPALKVLRDIGKRDPALAGKAADVEAMMENHRGGHASKAYGDITLNQTDLAGNRVGPSLTAIVSQLKPHEHEAFSTYIALKRAQEIESQGKRSGFEHAKLPPAEMAALEARFESTRQQLLSYMDNSLQLMVDAGILSTDAANKMRQANRDYVPFYRLYEHLQNVSFGPEAQRNGGGYVDLRSTIHKLTGSDRAIMDPLQSVMKNTYMFRKLAEQNHIADKFFAVVEEMQGHGEWGQGIAPKVTPTKVAHADVVKKLIEEGVIAKESDLPFGADLAMTLWKAMHKPDTKNGEVIFFRKGEPKHWEIKDPYLMTALKTADADAVKLFNFFGPTLSQFMTLPTRVKRFGATGGPWFAIPNFIRDQITAGVQSQAGYVPFWDGVKGGMQVLFNGQKYQRFVESGGAFHGFTTHTQAMTSMLDDVLPKDRSARAMAKVLMHPRTWKKGLEALGNLAEEATRVGEFMRNKEKGSTDMVAANAAKFVSLNFARSGPFGRSFNMIEAFLNAHIQDVDQVIRLHVDPKTRAGVVMRSMAYITLPSVIAWALGKDDKKIQALPEWQKNLFWNFNIEPLARALGRKDGFVLSIPKPFLLGAIYGTSVERVLDQATGRDPNGARKAVSNLFTQSLSMGEMITSIAGLQPIIEHMFNYDVWKGRPIVPERSQNLPKPQQYDIATSETAKMLGRFTGQSPMMIDHMIGSYFATAGKWGVDAIDFGMAKLHLANVPPPAKSDLMEWKILNRFSGSPYEANAYVERFYSAANDMEGRLQVFRKQTDQMTTDDQAKWWKENGDDVLFYEQTMNRHGLTGAGEVRKTLKALGEINGAMKEVQASREMTPEMKRAYLMDLAKQRNETAEDGFKGLFPEAVRKRFY